MFFLIEQDEDGMFRWSLKAGNNEVIADSNQSYKRKRDARKGIALVQELAGGAQILEQVATRRKKLSPVEIDPRRVEREPPVLTDTLDESSMPLVAVAITRHDGGAGEV